MAYLVLFPSNKLCRMIFSKAVIYNFLPKISKCLIYRNLPNLPVKIWIFFQTVDVLKHPEVSTHDMEMLQEFGSLTVIQIMEKFQELKNQAYQLGLEEAREMTRGRYLDVLGKRKHRRKPLKWCWNLLWNHFRTFPCYFRSLYWWLELKFRSDSDTVDWILNWILVI